MECSLVVAVVGVGVDIAAAVVEIGTRHVGEGRRRVGRRIESG